MRVHTAPGSGKTETYLHLSDRVLPAHKGGRRVWLEGKRLTDAGFRDGVRYQVGTDGEGLVISLSAVGDHRVSHKEGRPVIDLITRALGDVETAQVRFYPRRITVTLHTADRLAAARVARLNARWRENQPLELGSLSHGIGVASSGILDGLGRSHLAFANDLNEDSIVQSLRHGPLRKGGISIAADLRDLDPRDLPEVDIVEAGLPCVAASKAGKSKKHLERPADDPQVTDLEVAFLEVLRATQPAVVVLENVPEYATSDEADRIRRWLERNGYVTSERVLEGLEWSLENRRRWILLAAARGLHISLDDLVGEREHEQLSEVLDRRTPAAAWGRFEHLAAKEARDLAAGKGFRQQLLTASSTRVPCLRKGYQKTGSTDPRLVHPTRPGLSRRLSPTEHARIKGVPTSMLEGLSEKVAHEVLGQSVIRPAFISLGRLIGGAVQ